jgi:hypothetical protein
MGILAAAAVTAIFTAIWAAAYPAGDFPLGMKDFTTYSYTDEGIAASWKTASLTQQASYAQAIKDSCPFEADFLWRAVLAFGAIPAACTMYTRLKLAETPRFTLHTLQNNAMTQSNAAFMQVRIHLKGCHINEKHAHSLFLKCSVGRLQG